MTEPADISAAAPEAVLSVPLSDADGWPFPQKQEGCNPGPGAAQDGQTVVQSGASAGGQAPWWLGAWAVLIKYLSVPAGQLTSAGADDILGAFPGLRERKGSAYRGSVFDTILREGGMALLALPARMALPVGEKVAGTPEKMPVSVRNALKVGRAAGVSAARTAAIPLSELGFFGYGVPVQFEDAASARDRRMFEAELADLKAIAEHSHGSSQLALSEQDREALIGRVADQLVEQYRAQAQRDAASHLDDVLLAQMAITAATIIMDFAVRAGAAWWLGGVDGGLVANVLTLGTRPLMKGLAQSLWNKTHEIQVAEDVLRRFRERLGQGDALDAEAFGELEQQVRKAYLDSPAAMEKRRDRLLYEPHLNGRRRRKARVTYRHNENDELRAATSGTEREKIGTVHAARRKVHSLELRLRADEVRSQRDAEGVESLIRKLDDPAYPDDQVRLLLDRHAGEVFGLFATRTQPAEDMRVTYTQAYNRRFQMQWSVRDMETKVIPVLIQSGRRYWRERVRHHEQEGDSLVRARLANWAEKYPHNSPRSHRKHVEHCYRLWQDGKKLDAKSAGKYADDVLKVQALLSRWANPLVSEREFEDSVQENRAALLGVSVLPGEPAQQLWTSFRGLFGEDGARADERLQALFQSEVEEARANVQKLAFREGRFSQALNYAATRGAGSTFPQDLKQLWRLDKIDKNIRLWTERSQAVRELDEAERQLDLVRATESRALWEQLEQADPTVTTRYARADEMVAELIALGKERPVTDGEFAAAVEERKTALLKVSASDDRTLWWDFLALYGDDQDRVRETLRHTFIAQSRAAASLPEDGRRALQQEMSVLNSTLSLELEHTQLSMRQSRVEGQLERDARYIESQRQGKQTVEGAADGPVSDAVIRAGQAGRLGINLGGVKNMMKGAVRDTVARLGLRFGKQADYAPETAPKPDFDWSATLKNQGVSAVMSAGITAADVLTSHVVDALSVPVTPAESPQEAPAEVSTYTEGPGDGQVVSLVERQKGSSDLLDGEGYAGGESVMLLKEPDGAFGVYAEPGSGGTQLVITGTPGSKISAYITSPQDKSIWQIYDVQLDGQGVGRLDLATATPDYDGSPGKAINYDQVWVRFDTNGDDQPDSYAYSLRGIAPWTKPQEVPAPHEEAPVLPAGDTGESHEDKSGQSGPPVEESESGRKPYSPPESGGQTKTPEQGGEAPGQEDAVRETGRRAGVTPSGLVGSLATAVHDALVETKRSTSAREADDQYDDITDDTGEQTDDKQASVPFAAHQQDAQGGEGFEDDTDGPRMDMPEQTTRPPVTIQHRVQSVAASQNSSAAAVRPNQQSNLTSPEEVGKGALSGMWEGIKSSVTSAKDTVFASLKRWNDQAYNVQPSIDKPVSIEIVSAPPSPAEEFQSQFMSQLQFVPQADPTETYPDRSRLINLFQRASESPFKGDPAANPTEQIALAPTVYEYIRDMVFKDFAAGLHDQLPLQQLAAVQSLITVSGELKYTKDKASLLKFAVLQSDKLNASIRGRGFDLLMNKSSRISPGPEQDRIWSAAEQKIEQSTGKFQLEAIRSYLNATRSSSSEEQQFARFSRVYQLAHEGNIPEVVKIILDRVPTTPLSQFRNEFIRIYEIFLAGPDPKVASDAAFYFLSQVPLPPSDTHIRYDIYNDILSDASRHRYDIRLDVLISLADNMLTLVPKGQLRVDAQKALQDNIPDLPTEEQLVLYDAVASMARRAYDLDPKPEFSALLGEPMEKFDLRRKFVADQLRAEHFYVSQEQRSQQNSHFPDAIRAFNKEFVKRLNEIRIDFGSQDPEIQKAALKARIAILFGVNPTSEDLDDSLVLLDSASQDVQQDVFDSFIEMSKHLPRREGMLGESPRTSYIKKLSERLPKMSRNPKQALMTLAAVTVEIAEPPRNFSLRTATPYLDAMRPIIFQTKNLIEGKDFVEMVQYLSDLAFMTHAHESINYSAYPSEVYRMLANEIANLKEAEKTEVKNEALLVLIDSWIDYWRKYTENGNELSPVEIDRFRSDYNIIRDTVKTIDVPASDQLSSKIQGFKEDMSMELKGSVAAEIERIMGIVSDAGLPGGKTLATVLGTRTANTQRVTSQFAAPKGGIGKSSGSGLTGRSQLTMARRQFARRIQRNPRSRAEYGGGQSKSPSPALPSPDSPFSQGILMENDFLLSGVSRGVPKGFCAGLMNLYVMSESINPGVGRTTMENIFWLSEMALGKNWPHDSKKSARPIFRENLKKVYNKIEKLQEDNKSNFDVDKSSPVKTGDDFNGLSDGTYRLRLVGERGGHAVGLVKRGKDKFEYFDPNHGIYNEISANDLFKIIKTGPYEQFYAMKIKPTIKEMNEFGKIFGRISSDLDEESILKELLRVGNNMPDISDSEAKFVQGEARIPGSSLKNSGEKTTQNITSASDDGDMAAFLKGGEKKHDRSQEIGEHRPRVILPHRRQSLEIGQP